MSNGGPRSQGHDERALAQARLTDALDCSTPNVARMYDYYLGGKENYPPDREAARLVLGAAPDVPLAALENREFLRRALHFLVTEAHLSQFIDIGPGLPTQGNVHQVVRQYDAQAQVVYVDNDPVVLAHGRSLLHELPGVSIISGDVRQPEDILANAELRQVIDFSRPVALCLSLVLHFITSAENPHGIVARLRDALCPGSYLVLTHVTSDERDIGTISQVTAVYDEATASLVPRTHDEIIRLFAGFELVEPGVVFLSQWRPTAEYYAAGGTRWAYAGVGRKPEDAG